MYGDGSIWGISGWGNNELECYTDSPLNVAVVPDPLNVTNGILNITAVYSKGKTCWNQVRHWALAVVKGEVG